MASREMRHTEFIDGIWDDFLNKRMMVIQVAPGEDYIVEWECASYIDSLIDEINDRQYEINKLNSTIKRLREHIRYYRPNDSILQDKYLF